MSLANDVRFAFRQLRKSPAFTVVVLATLGLCIGANTAIYSVLDAVLLRAAPYPEPDRLALVTTVWWQNGKQDSDTSQTGAQFEGVRDRVPGLDVAAFSGDNGANFSSPGHLEYIRQQRVSTGFFRVMGVAPQFGREFEPAEDQAGGPPVAVLSYGFWQRIFHGDAAALGRSIDLRGEPYTVVGVMPRGFRVTSPIDVWTPLRPARTGEGSGSNYGVAARLKPGVSWAAAAQQLKALSRGMDGVNVPPGVSFEERIVPFQRGVSSERRSELLVTFGAVLVVLLIGCVNIAGLLLARAGAREREIATRMALGGGRAAIVRQLLVESLLLALGGCAVGIALGSFAIDWLKRLGAADFALWHPIELDARVLAAMLAISLLTSLLFGLAPAIQTSRLDIRSVLIEAGRGVAGGRRRWSRHALVAGEVALSLVLLVSAGLLVRTLAHLNGLSPGFDPRHVIAAGASLQDARYQTSAAVNRLYGATLDRIRAIPGVESAAVALTLPYERPLNDGFQLEGEDGKYHGTEVVYITPGYFDTLRIPLLRGRPIQASDTAGSAPVAVVSQSLASKYLRGVEAIGRHLKMEGVTMEIVGVVGDVEQHSGLGNFGPISLEPTIYTPVSQASSGFLRVIHTWFAPQWVIRAAGPMGALTPRVAAAVAAVDPRLPIASFQTMEQLQGVYTRGQRYDAALFSILAGLALLLAAIGLYGLIAQSITGRMHELGVRMALGATAPQTIVNVMKPALLLALVGVAAGYGSSLVAVRFLRHLLWGIQPTDPLTFIATAAILLAVALLASLIPALRLLRLDPARTLRSE
ncbi:MAG: ABC transporter permease [Acidobacteriia bacterium]|nr:ABC transporter permease [Terriglobia bacterium]